MRRSDLVGDATDVAPRLLNALLSVRDADGVLRVGGPADLVVLAARGWAELLARCPQRRVLRAGRWLEPPGSEQPSPLLAGLLAGSMAGAGGST